MDTQKIEVVMFYNDRKWVVAVTVEFYYNCRMESYFEFDTKQEALEFKNTVLNSTYTAEYVGCDTHED